MYNSKQPNETADNKQQTESCTTEIGLMKQQTTNQPMCNHNQPNETTDNKPNHVQQLSAL